MSINSNVSNSDSPIKVENKQVNDAEKIQTDFSLQTNVSETTSKNNQNQQNTTMETVNLELNYTSKLTGKIKVEDIDFNSIAISSSNALNGKFLDKNRLNMKYWDSSNGELDFKEFSNGSVLISSKGTALGWTTKQKLLNQISKNYQNNGVKTNVDDSKNNLSQTNNSSSSGSVTGVSTPQNVNKTVAQTPNPVNTSTQTSNPVKKINTGENVATTNTKAWAKWRQYDKRWKSIKIGKRTVGSSGCLLTSLAIQLARTGKVKSDFNPGVFVKRVKAVHGMNGASFGGPGALKRAYPNIIKSASLNKNVKIKNINDLANKLRKLISQGNYIVLKVKYPPNGQHWVAVTRVDSKGNIYIVDPAGKSGQGEVKLTKSLNKKYNIFSRKSVSYYCFKTK